MPRLPQPGGDAYQWGHLLNEFLGESHNLDGSLKLSAVSSHTSIKTEIDARLAQKASKAELRDAIPHNPDPATIAAMPEGALYTTTI